MSLLLKAFPHGRPHSSAPTGASLGAPTRRRPSTLAAALLAGLATLAMVAALVPLAGPADAARRPGHRTHHHAHQAHHRAHHKAAHKKAAARRAAHKLAVHKKRAPRTPVGQPPRGFVVKPTSYFSFPNRSHREQMPIRKRVLLTINSTWGGPRTSLGTPMPHHGTIRMATWTFDDWDIAKALVAARKRGVSVQIVAAKGANRGHASWRWLRKRLGSRLARPGHPETRDTVSFARVCKGACRGPGGTAHAKYFLFDDVGPQHVRKITFQTSGNLTSMAYQGQWNQAQVFHSSRLYDDFLGVFRQARLRQPLARPYHVAAYGNVTDYFFPRPGATAPLDPVMQILNGVRCQGATTGAPGGRTKIRITQYAIYGDRGVWIARKLRALWKAGCNISIIYSVSSRPVLSILRSPWGRGPIPMRQSVERDYWGNIVKYNHSKWMTIAGNWGGSTAAYLTFTGSANWANLAFGDDEQMQRISSARELKRYNATFAKTWGQSSSRAPRYGRFAAFGRGWPSLMRGAFDRDVPRSSPAWGHGVYRYMTSD